ncbi:MAG TPA: biopolymer transporter ExbD [Acidobacteriaceae bacterium]|nr:biopolymer transporter ExbD [Acidobacteriaceae bacterium]
MAFTSRGGHTQTALAEINITPLVDVVLVLLVIFMLTAPVLQSGIQVNVPKTKTVREITEQRTVLTINKDSEVFLNDKPVNLNDLPNLLRTQASDTTRQQVIYLRADQSVSFGTFATLMDAVKQAGITNISIVTQPAENPPASH